MRTATNAPRLPFAETAEMPRSSSGIVGPGKRRLIEAPWLSGRDATDAARIRAPEDARGSSSSK
jgi:hypothetical protein